MNILKGRQRLWILAYALLGLAEAALVTKNFPRGERPTSDDLLIDFCIWLAACASLYLIGSICKLVYWGLRPLRA